MDFQVRSKEIYFEDEDFFDKLYSKYVQVLFVYGLQFTSDRELVKDCIQDVFVKLYEP